MEKLVRYRKAFYEKENDLQNGNKKRDIPISQKLKSMSSDKLYQSVSHVMLTKPLQPKDEKPKSNTKLFFQLYSEQLLSPAQYDKKPTQFLKNHNIDGTLRARMLDWMIEVISSYKFTHKTFFDGVRLMDSYFQAEKECLPPTKLHIVGVQCMLIASKMEEVYPLKMKTVYQKIGHKKLPMNQLVETQERIMKSLNYKLNSWTFFDLAMLKISEFVCKNPQNRQALGQLFSYSSNVNNQNDDKTVESKIKQMQQICSYLSKFILCDYDFYCQNSMLLLAQAVVKATLEVMSITTPINLFISSPIMIELCQQKLFKLILNFKHRNQGLNNIFKFTSKEIILKVEQFL